MGRFFTIIILLFAIESEFVVCQCHIIIFSKSIMDIRSIIVSDMQLQVVPLNYIIYFHTVWYY